MKVLNNVLGVAGIAVNGFVLVLKLLVVVPAALITKRNSCNSFRKEIENLNLPPEVVAELTNSYRNMVSLDIRSYTK
jgi:hypothetical protein